MTTHNSERSRTEAVQALFDGLQQFSRALRSRSGDWGASVRDLSRGDLVTLGVVARQKTIRCGQIASTLGVDPSVVSRQLAALERLGLVARCADAADRRAELISATPLGRDQLREARAAMCEALGLRLGCWDPDSIIHAAAVVEELAGLLHEMPGDLPGDLPGDMPGDTPNSADTLTTATSKDAHA